MEEQLEEIRKQQRATWNKFSPGWKKWDELFMDFLKPVGNEIIRAIHSKKNTLVLDVASGTGEPGLTIASMLNEAKVVITDLSENMLEIARQNATQRGIKNIETHTCDVSELPFADNTFDAISCRFGFMFFPDMLMAAKEMVRVLKPGGKIAASVWNVPGKNFWITAIMETINRNMQLPALQPGAPGMFRCAEDGFMADLYTEAGLKNVLIKEVAGKMNCKTTSVYWNVMTEVAAPVVASLGKADNVMREKIRREVFQVVSRKYREGNVMIDSSAIVISGEK